MISVSVVIVRVREKRMAQQNPNRPHIVSLLAIPYLSVSMWDNEANNQFVLNNL